ncbi:MAG: ATP-binding cassette domain-containing protein [Cyclobacteriaceae bacterium]|nr:ATP-binding cassette domain-containing protein [Cyclobacteriaceae bacterium]
MNEPVIETTNLSYHFGTHQVLHDLSISVPAGSIYGFLGHNGAGKTTTIKILLSLLQDFHGDALILNKDIRSRRMEILARIGSLVEAPGLYHHLTGWENLRIRSLLLSVVPEKIVDTLRTVGLMEVKNRLVRHYSHGMKQRLGIALALLSDPQILILDEPTNGLDPTGIKEIRELLTTLRSLGKTIFLSSHILSEVEKIITDVGIIHKGRLLYGGGVEGLKASGANLVEFDVLQPDLTRELLTMWGISFESNHHLINIPCKSNARIAELTDHFVTHGISVIGIRKLEKSLEHVYFELVEKEMQQT